MTDLSRHEHHTSSACRCWAFSYWAWTRSLTSRSRCSRTFGSRGFRSCEKIYWHPVSRTTASSGSLENIHPRRAATTPLLLVQQVVPLGQWLHVRRNIQPPMADISIELPPQTLSHVPPPSFNHSSSHPSSLPSFAARTVAVGNSWLSCPAPAAALVLQFNAPLTCLQRAPGKACDAWPSTLNNV